MAQTWHVPSRASGIAARPVMDMVIQKPAVPAEKQAKRQVVEGRRSTLYNPIRCPLSDIDLSAQLCPYFDSLSWADRPQYSQLWAACTVPELVQSALGSVPKGSPLSYQQPLCVTTDEVVVIDSVPVMPDFCFPNPEEHMRPFMPLPHDSSVKFESLYVTASDVKQYELMTRQQADCDLWHRLRHRRITASKFKSICSRRRDFVSLADQMLKTKHVLTAAMKYGIDNEPKAAESYAKLFGVNIYRCGFVIHPQCFFLGCSPDRRVYDPDSAVPWGLMEIKCTTAVSVADCDYLKSDGTLQLKRNHAYYYQVVAQMGLSGSHWCDFFVFAQEDYHCERIYADNNCHLWNDMMQKVVSFFFEYLVHKM